MIISAAAIIIAVVINLLAAEIPGKYTRFDTSSLGFFTLSEETEDIIEAIEQDVTVFHIAETGAEDEAISSLLRRYTELNSHITIQNIDPVLQPTFTATYSATPLGADTLIFRSDLRYHIVTREEIYAAEYSIDLAAGTIDTVTAFAGENKITSAIVNVTTETLPVMYLITGHGSGALSEEFRGYLADDNITVKELSLLTAASVPEDASAIMLAAPSNDITEDEYKKLSEYISNGGKIYLITRYAAPSDSPNLMKLVSLLGVEAIPGIVIDNSTSTSAAASGYPQFLWPTVQSGSIASLAGDATVFLPTVHPIKPVKNLPAEIKVETLLETSDIAFARVDLESTKENGEAYTTSDTLDSDIAGPFAVGISATNSRTGARLVWIPTDMFINDDSNGLSAGGNAAYFLAAANDLCGNTVSVSVASKVMQIQALNISGTASIVWGVILCGVLPALVLGAGIAVWLKRRSR